MMPGFAIFILAGGVFAALLLMTVVFSGPSASKLLAKRLEGVRERHSRSSEVVAQAQLKRIFANRQQNAAEGFAQRFIPNPALLRLRLQQTGKNWTLVHYVAASFGIWLAVAAVLSFKGVPLLLAGTFGLFIGI